MKKQRSSNLELLRVVAMVMITMFHIWMHCVDTQLTNADSIARMQNGWFSTPEFFARLLLLQTISPFGRTGNAIFILISGFFLVQKGQNIDLGKTARKLLFQQGFAAVLLTVGSALCFACFPGVFIEMIDINGFNKLSWFVGYYFVVILCAYLFLNRWLAKLSQKQYQTFLWVMFALTQMEWTAQIIDGISGGLIRAVTGIFLYAMGGYIRAYDPFRGIRTGWLLLAIGAIYALIYLSEYNSTQNAIQKYWRDGGSGAFKQSMLAFSNHYFVPIAFGILLFEIFRRISMPNSKIINYVAQATFITYLLQDNKFFYSLWNTQDWITLLYENPLWFAGKILLWALGVLGVGVIAYALYERIEKALAAWLAARRAEETV